LRGHLCSASLRTSDMEPCDHCGATAQKECTGCNSAYYCDVECQAAHYPEHKMECIGKRAGGGRSHLSHRQQGKAGVVMHEFKEGHLHSGSKTGPIVRSRKQAIAIALSEARKYGKK
jgi:hypothetical protein